MNVSLPPPSAPLAPSDNATENVPPDRPSAILSFVQENARRLQPSEADALFSALLEERQRELTALVYGITGDYHASQDIIQEVYLKLYKFLSQRKIDMRLIGWLRKVTMNAALDYRRQRRRADVTMPSDQMESVAALVPTISDAGEQICRQLAKRLTRLKDRHREIFELHALDALSFRQIADQMNLSETNCRIIYHRVCQHLRKAGKG